MIYALSLAVYCTSWSFFGNVGAAATDGWSYLAVYIGPIIAFGVFAPVLRKMLLIAKQQNTTSIADFIGARYGKSQSLAGLVALVALVVILPYIALQLDAITMSFNTIVHGVYSRPGSDIALSGWTDTGLLVAIGMAIFTVAFGTRHVNPRESHQGIIRAIAFESLIKLSMFSIVGAYVTFVMFGGLGELMARAHATDSFNALFNAPLITPRFITILVLSTAAVFCLPRQFHVGVVENTDSRDLATARWLFPVYLFLMSLFVVPLAAAGIVLFGTTTVEPDRFVMALTLANGSSWLTLAAYVGGLSAATSMVIMATITLATMLCNEVVVPVVMRLPWVKFGQSRDLSRSLLITRRVLIGLILIMAWGVYRLFATGQTLAGIGLLSLSGAVLFVTPMIGGIFIRRITRRGAMNGLIAGLIVWLYTLVLPMMAVQGWLPDAWLTTGPLDIDWLQPQALFDTHFGDPLTHGVFWTLAVQIFVTAAVSMNTSITLIERAQAVAFVNLGVRRASASRSDVRPPAIRVGELEVLLQRFLGPQSARAALNEYAGHHDRQLLTHQIVDASLLQFAEQRLAGVVGSSSARLMLASGLRQRDLALDDMVRLLDRTADAVQFNRNVLQAALENIDQGISVVDQDLRLVAWNTRYLELFEYPPGLARTGRHIADLIRFNAMRGECGPGSVEEHVRKRLEHLREGKPHQFERHRRNNTVLQMTGNPMPGGGFVTTFNDITEFKRNEAALTRMNEELEARVSARTEELSRANAGLRRENEQRAVAQRAALEARRDAERANLSKTRFLAAASHDLLQPLNAARLFAAGAEQGTRDAQHSALKQIQASLESAQTLLEPLLDISKIDAGAWDVKPQSFPLSRILDPLTHEFEVLARNAGLSLHAVPCSAWVRSDPNLLRRILQNFLSNAVRYTETGHVLIGARRQREALRIEIWDTGPGIETDQLGSIFEEFQRGTTSHGAAERGLGLGLSLADRMSRLLGHRIDVDSKPGRGTVFRLTVERVAPETAPAQPHAEDSDKAGHKSIGTALCVDDDPASLDALVGLLERWDIDCMTAPPEDAAAIMADESFDVAIFDYDLGADVENGMSRIERLRPDFPDTRFLLVTANRDQTIVARAEASSTGIIYKPIGPVKLRAAIYGPTIAGEVEVY
ncbi:PAS domain-containing hybrid sensor histidine kinase/response regulator [Salinisphaera sp. Q1T1-3]|uniref:PAS domain-containing hybrid sensor histidine kinase/response regulator n=1 Tax=Salinisphaera sp. Q1T1-3 TaxID=2321229 RepID=UPI000E74E459|nr:PAS domain-containing hybrid sensor histidine kinase/response regulator [Salinisphaera sp. Q1T1-3]RJS95004.1 response regulator [Salinisphaera sp. Q1T1-3]